MYLLLLLSTASCSHFLRTYMHIALLSHGDTIEGLIPASRASQFRGQLKEGSIYTIERFNIYDAKKTYKSVDHLYRICFTQRTLVNEVLPQPENFPMFAYNAFPFSMLAARTDENVLLSDVIGLVTDVTEVTPASGSSKQQKRHIYISDGNYNTGAANADGYEAIDIVRIPRRVLLQAVAMTRGLTIYGIGHDNNTMTTITGWVKIDLPRRANETSSRQRTFHGDPAATAAEAQENAAQAALAFLCKHHNITIDDYNYSALRRATASALSAQQWANTRERQLSRTRQQLADLQNEYRNKMKALRKICAHFSDLIPSGGTDESTSNPWPPQLLPLVHQLISAVRDFIAGTPAGRRTDWF